jgi:N-acetylmuramic acid 6-phosphate (MurNAc-6-P) etherase
MSLHKTSNFFSSVRTVDRVCHLQELKLIRRLIAGGDKAIHRAVEGAEDSPEAGIFDLKRLHPPLDPLVDTVIGLAASGRTPYVLGGLRYASDLGCFTAGICCVTPSAMLGLADEVVECPVGAEAVTGSTRMKSGTAQKMVSSLSWILLSLDPEYNFHWLSSPNREDIR